MLNNPSNIKKGSKPYVGEMEEDNDDKVYRSFYSLFLGYRATLLEIKEIVSIGNATVRQFCYRCMMSTKPKSEDFTDFICANIDKNRDKLINIDNKDELLNLATAIIYYFSGRLPDKSMLLKAYDNLDINKYL